MATLRHHGFPAPLLDWTYSPYVAAFFAFNEKRDVENVAVFAYREFCGSGKGYEGNKPRIETFGPSAPIHHRHIRQQNTYTIALKKSDTGLVFASYEEAFQKRPLDFLSFDEVTKFEISAVARDDAIIDLIKMNVTEYSLFGSDDALVKTIAQLLKYRKW
jgi:hypothetical protein